MNEPAFDYCTEARKLIEFTQKICNLIADEKTSRTEKSISDTKTEVTDVAEHDDLVKNVEDLRGEDEFYIPYEESSRGHVMKYPETVLAQIDRSSSKKVGREMNSCEKKTGKDLDSPKILSTQLNHYAKKRPLLQPEPLSRGRDLLPSQHLNGQKDFVPVAKSQKKNIQEHNRLQLVKSAQNSTELIKTLLGDSNSLRSWTPIAQDFSNHLSTSIPPPSYPSGNSADECRKFEDRSNYSASPYYSGQPTAGLGNLIKPFEPSNGPNTPVDQNMPCRPEQYNPYAVNLGSYLSHPSYIRQPQEDSMIQRNGIPISYQPAQPPTAVQGFPAPPPTIRDKALLLPNSRGRVEGFGSRHSKSKTTDNSEHFSSPQVRSPPSRRSKAVNNRNKKKPKSLKRMGGIAKKYNLE